MRIKQIGKVERGEREMESKLEEREIGLLE